MTTEEARTVLGLGADVTPEDARRAYLRLVRVHKPDRDPEVFQRLRAAWETLQGDPARAAPPRRAAGEAAAGPDDAWDAAEEGLRLLYDGDVAAAVPRLVASVGPDVDDPPVSVVSHAVVSLWSVEAVDQALVVQAALAPWIDATRRDGGSRLWMAAALADAARDLPPAPMAIIARAMLAGDLDGARPGLRAWARANRVAAVRARHALEKRDAPLLDVCRPLDVLVSVWDDPTIPSWARAALFGLVTLVIAVLHLKGWSLSALFIRSQPLTPPITRAVAGLGLPLDSAPPSAHNADSERPGEEP